MKKEVAVLLFCLFFTITGCKKCVQCEVEYASTVYQAEEFCGTNKEVDEYLESLDPYGQYNDMGYLIICTETN